MNAANGQLVWNYSNGFGFGNPIVVNGVLYIVSNEQVYAIQIPSSTIEPKPEPESFPVISVIASIAIVIIVSAGLLIYFKKHNKPKQLVKKF